MNNFRHNTALVTGGTDGIGKEIAYGLARDGHEVIIAGHDPKKGASAQVQLRSRSGNGNVWYFPADLSLMQDTQRLSEQVLQCWPSIRYLVHSAGIVRGRR